jgi:hypothetical protein
MAILVKMPHSPHFISEANARRNRHFELSVGNAAEMLGHPAVIRGLGRHASQSYSDTLGRLRLPNFHNGDVTMGHFADDDLPFVPLLDDETLTISSAHLLPSEKQRAAMRGFLSRRVLRQLDRQSETRQTVSEATLFKGLNSDIGCPSFSWERRIGPSWNSQEWTFIGRPVLFERSAEHVSRSVPVLLHELVHLQQDENAPYWLSSRETEHFASNELEAYHKHNRATTVILPVDTSKVFTSKAAVGYANYARDVETVRAKHADPAHPYRTTPDMVAELIDQELDITGTLAA